MAVSQTPTRKTARAAAQPHACECSHWWAGDITDIEAGTVKDELQAACTESTTRTFSPGHDARLKSFLIQAGIDGVEVHDGRGSTSDPITAAARFGFVLQVTAGIKRGQDRQATRAAREARKAERKANARPPREVPVKVVETPPARVEYPVRVKIGRWEYDAQIQSDGAATYRDRQGILKTAPAGTFKRSS